MSFPGSLPPPGWVDSGAEPNDGLDLLGLRLPVQLLSNSLLAGITTITPSVRYISFQTWIVHSYASSRRADRSADFRTFAAAAESAIVLGNLIHDSKTIGLIGSDRGREVLAGGLDPVPLDRLVKQLAINIYANPSFQLGLTFPRDTGVPGLSQERGLPLAESVRALVAGTSVGDLLSEGELPESVTRSELSEFGARLAVRTVPSKERALLLAAILPRQPRPAELPRLETYAILLHLARVTGRVPKEEDVFEAAWQPLRSLPSDLHRALDGWLRYSVRDLLAATGEAAFEVIIGALQRLGRSKSSVASTEVLGALLGDEFEHTEALRELGLVGSQETAWSLTFDDLYDRIASRLNDPKTSSGGLRRWAGSLNEWKVMQSALDRGPSSLTLVPVAWSLATLRCEPWDADQEGPFEDRADIGWARLGLDEVIRPTVRDFRSNQTPLRDVVVDLSYRIVDQHLRVAWSRMAADAKRDIAVLVTDGDDWHARGKGVVASRTASRIREAIDWLRQLDLVDSSGVSANGDEVLDELLKTLAENRREPT